MERARFVRLSCAALEHLDDTLGGLEHDDLDVDLAGDVLTLAFRDGATFIINAHSAALQIWMAANSSAWHFDFQGDSQTWVARRTNDELLATIAKVVGDKLGITVKL